MVKKISLLGKMQAIGIIIIFFCASVVSSTNNIDNDISCNNQILDKVDESEELFSPIKYGYAYNAYPGPECTVYFPLNDPGDITECGDTISGDFLYGGTMEYDEVWYAQQYGNGLLYGIDPNTCDMWSIGGGGTGGGDLAWDDWTQKLYSAPMMGLAFNNEGICYGIKKVESVFNLYIVDFDPYSETLIGPLINFTTEWGLEAEFDKDTNELYILGNGGINGGLYKCDVETRECTFIGSTGSIELTAFAIPYDEYDTTPFTEISFDPPKPDGENDWYVSNVTATLTPIGFVYGVDATYYRISGGEWGTYQSPFIISEEGNDILIEYYTVDNNGTVEEVKSATVDIDKTSPDVEVTWEIIGGNPIVGWEILITVNVNENYSGMDRVEFYLNDVLQETVHGSGPTYNWRVLLISLNTIQVNGLICNRVITDENVSFYSIFMKASENPGLNWIVGVGVCDQAGNMDRIEILIKRPNVIEPGLYLFQKLTLPNNYWGYLGRFLVFAKF
ncbi:MAG: hypothetical protein JSU91_02870 [Thermoplasmatales archaeon]|nr:MAG: hypothetical protein JSU91_02870 [Thermoplasmatales archaeon]